MRMSERVKEDVMEALSPPKAAGKYLICLFPQLWLCPILYQLNTCPPPVLTLIILFL